MARLNPFARVPVCGLISQYNLAALPPGLDRSPWLLTQVLTKRLTLRGFIVSDFAAQEPQFLAEVIPLVAQGKIKYHEDVVEGLQNAPAGLIGLLRGENLGKRIVHVANKH